MHQDAPHGNSGRHGNLLTTAPGGTGARAASGPPFAVLDRAGILICMSLEPRLEHQTVKIKQLVQEYRAGHIVIPEFQRDYVWAPKRAPVLMDSLYRQFPVSSLLLWQGAGETRARRRDPRPSSGAMVNWLIDGQQRVITLSRIMNGDEGIDVVFHPEREEFRRASASTRREGGWVRVSEVLDDDLYRQLRRNLDGGPGADRREERLEALRRILQYEIPVVRMVDHSFEDAVTAFTRINTLGVRLKREDIESAKVAARHSGFVADKVIPFLANLRLQGFTRLNVMHLFRACAFVARPDGRRRTPLHELDRKEVLDAWKKTEKATKLTIALIRSELGLVNMSILWSGTLVVPLIALCARMPPRQRDAKELIGWLGLAALCHRYSGSSETMLDQDLRACRSPDPVGALLSNLRANWDLKADPDNDFSGALADRSGMLAMYIACMHRGMRDFFTGAKVLLQDNVDRHHILPRRQFPDGQRSQADRIANMAFIAGDVNRSISHTGPEVYLPKIAKDILESQCIPTDEALWRIDEADAFWHARRVLLAESFNDFLRSALPQRKI